MKTFNISKFGLIILLTLLLSIQTIRSMSLSEPIPVDLKMIRGDSARFYFFIGTAGSGTRQFCSYTINGMEPLIITLDENKITMNPDENKRIYGTISVPDDAPIKTYTGKLAVDCKPDLKESESGGSMITNSMGTQFKVDVVGKQEERIIQNIPEKEKPKVSPIILILIIIILILAIVGFYFSRKKK